MSRVVVKNTIKILFTEPMIDPLEITHDNHMVFVKQGEKESTVIPDGDLNIVVETLQKISEKISESKKI